MCILLSDNNAVIQCLTNDTQLNCVANQYGKAHFLPNLTSDSVVDQIFADFLL